MKILITTPIYPPEIADLALYVKKISIGLSVKNEVAIISYSNNPEKTDSVELITISKHKTLIVRLLKFTTILFKKSLNVDVIYTQNAVIAGLPSVIIGKLRKIPIVLRFVGDEAWERALYTNLTKKSLPEFLEKKDSNLKIKLLYYIQKFVLHSTNTIVVPSKYMMRILIRYYNVPEEKITINYNFFTKKISLPFHLDRTNNQIYTIQKTSSNNDINIIIKTIVILKKEFPKIKLFVAGRSLNIQKQKELVQKLHLADNIKFLGDVSQAENIFMLETSTIFIQNSIDENIPDILFDAFQSDIPVIISGKDALSEIATNKESGIILDNPTIENLSKKITQIFKDTKETKNMTNKSRNILEKEFSFEIHEKKLEEILYKTIKNTKK